MTSRLAFHITALLLCAVLTGCGATEVSRVVELGGCAELSVQGDFTLGLRATDSTIIELRGQPVDLAGVVVQASGTRVSITSTSSQTLHAQVSCPDLVALELIGSVAVEQDPDAPMPLYDKIAVYGDSRFAAQNLNAGALDLRASGNGQIAIEQLVADSLQMLLAGQSQVLIEGTTGRFEVDLGGDARLTAIELQAQTVILQARGHSQAGVFATAHLDADLQDAASLAYTGTPDLHIERTKLTRLHKL
jgi:hypothetical protein